MNRRENIERLKAIMEQSRLDKVVKEEAMKKAAAEEVPKKKKKKEELKLEVEAKKAE